MKRYIKIFEIPEGKAKEYVPTFQQQAQFIEINSISNPKVVLTIDSALSCISYTKNNTSFYALTENTSLKSLLS